MKYEDYLQKYIFDPLQMTDTGYDWPSTILKDRASGYSKDDAGKEINADFLDMGQPYAVGSHVEAPVMLHIEASWTLIEQRVKRVLVLHVARGVAVGDVHLSLRGVQRL